MDRPASSLDSARSIPIDLAAVVADEAEFRRFYEATAARVYAYLYSRTGSIAVAEDLTQETYAEVITHPHGFDGRADPVPWLIGIARHRLSRHYRRERRDLERGSRFIADLGPELDGRELAAADERFGIESALGSLPPDQRAALMLRFVDDLSVRDVAGILGRSVDATESLIRRARRAFEDAYGRGSR